MVQEIKSKKDYYRREYNFNYLFLQEHHPDWSMFSQNFASNFQC